MNAEKLLRIIESVNVPKAYQMRWNEALAIRESSDDVMERMLMAFNYGFLKGQRAAKKSDVTE